MVSDFLFTVVSLIQGGIRAVEPWVMGLAGTLIAIDMSVYGIQMAMGKANNLSENIMKLLIVGVMLFIIRNWAYLSVALMNSIVRFGSAVSQGVASANLPRNVAMSNFDPDVFLDPSAILRLARDEVILPLVAVFEGAGDDLRGLARLGDRMEAMAFQGIVIGGVLVAFFIIAVQVAIALIEFWMVVLFSLILVPFTLWKPLEFIGQKSFSAVVGQAVKVGVIAVTTGIVLNVFKQVIFIPSGGELGFDDAANILLASFLCSFLVLQLPALAGTLLSGVPSMSAGAMFSAAAGTIAGAKAGGKMLGKVPGVSQAMKAGQGLAKAGAVAAGGAAAAGASSVLRAGAKMGQGAANRIGQGVAGQGAHSSELGANAGSRSAMPTASGGGGGSGSTETPGAAKVASTVIRQGAEAAKKSAEAPKSAGDLDKGQAGHAVRGDS